MEVISIKTLFASAKPLTTADCQGEFWGLWLLLKFQLLPMLGGYSKKFLQRQHKIQFSRDNLGEQQAKGPGEHIFRFSESLKSKILAAMLPPLRYTEFIITNLPF